MLAPMTTAELSVLSNDLPSSTSLFLLISKYSFVTPNISARKGLPLTLKLTILFAMMGVAMLTSSILEMISRSLQFSVDPTMPLPRCIWPGITMMFWGPKTSSCVLTSLLSPWVMETSPVTAVQPMRMPIRLRANLNFLSFRLSRDICAISLIFTRFHLGSQSEEPPEPCPEAPR